MEILREGGQDGGREGRGRAERLCSLIHEDTEVSGPFQMLTGGKYVKWVTLQMQGNLLACVQLCRKAEDRQRFFPTSRLHGTKWF